MTSVKKLHTRKIDVTWNQQEGVKVSKCQSFLEEIYFKKYIYTDVRFYTTTKYL